MQSVKCPPDLHRVQTQATWGNPLAFIVSPYQSMSFLTYTQYYFTPTLTRLVHVVNSLFEERIMWHHSKFGTNFQILRNFTKLYQVCQRKIQIITGVLWTFSNFNVVSAKPLTLSEYSPLKTFSTFTLA